LHTILKVSSKFTEAGESGRITVNNNVKKLAPYLAQVGFEGEWYEGKYVCKKIRLD